MSNTLQNIFIFDFEVDQYDWLVRFKYLGQDKWVNIHNSKDALVSFLKTEHASLFIGFNNKNYDDYIISAILNDRDPFEISKEIIVNGKKGWQTGLKRPSIATIDVKQDNFDNATLSLKEAEANMGLSIEESSVPFNMGRKWTYEETMEMAKYCGHDVEGTEKLFNMRADWLNTKSTLVNLEGFSKHELGDTNAQLTAKLLKAEKNTFNDDYIFDRPDDLDLGKYSNIIKKLSNGIPEDFGFEERLGNLNCKFGMGGLHGAEEKFISAPDKQYAFIDAEAYYPTIMICYNLLSRASKNKDGFISTFMKMREAERIGKEDARKAYKQVLVSTYGAMDNKYNKLYDPRARKNTAITGQLFLTDLIDKIEKYCNLVQVNTDGVLVEIKDLSALQTAVSVWENRTGFKMSWEFVDKIYQKDVNNYFARLTNGKIKVKGGYLKQSSDKWDGYSRNNMRVVDLALREYFDKGVDIEMFIKSHTNLNDFQLVVKAKDKMVETNHGQVLATHQKVNRLFATTNYLRGTFQGVPNIPNNIYVYNGNMMDINVNEINLDYGFYIDIAKKRLMDFGLQ